MTKKQRQLFLAKTRELLLSLGATQNGDDFILQTEAGKAAFKTVYDIDELEPVNDGYYEEFRIYVDESGVDLTKIIK